MKKGKSVAKQMRKEEKKRLKEEKRLAKKQRRAERKAGRKAKAGGKKVARAFLKFAKAISKMKPESRIHFARSLVAKKKVNVSAIYQLLPKINELNKAKRG